ncbi:MAG: hypothetical protein C3F11_17795 [Methylocystaceae bacterium]|nr:MAG: hypothetical protein C3F11_17795 [Methylocystaceae bacterium]
MAYSLLPNNARGVVREADGANIPQDPGNADWRVYLEWVAAGNAPAQPSAPTFEELRAEKLAALAERRRRAEASGTSVDGMRLPTDEKMQSKLTAAVVASVLDNAYSVQWKLADGSFVRFDHALLIAVAQTVRAHVQSCFDREAALSAQIRAAADVAAMAAIDIEAGWPG